MSTAMAMLTADEICWTPFLAPLPDPEPASPRPVAAAPRGMDEAAPLTYEDLVIRDLADGEAEALERAAALADALADLQAQYNAQREAYHTAVGILAQVTAHLEAARRTIQTLRHAERRYGTATQAAL